MKKQVGIIGASGYTGYELTKILLGHKKVELSMLNSKTYAGSSVSALYPGFEGDLKFTAHSVEQINDMCLDAVFLCLPHTVSAEYAGSIKAKIIDLSADHRFKDIESYEQIYAVQHPYPENAAKAVYGLPEFFREQIKKAELIANPGCYATACLLPGLPLKGFASRMIFDCVSGYSGAGKNSAFSRDPDILNENFIAYSLINHRHKPEIEQFMGKKIGFTPHVINAFKGMMCTAHILLEDNADAIFDDKADAKKIFLKQYKKEPFVSVCDDIPDIRKVQGTNQCLIGGFETDDTGRLVVISVIDNLLKGACGQAVQNMNLLFGFPETKGLMFGFPEPKDL